MSNSADGSNVLPWEKIPGAVLLKSWAAELRTACAGADDREWRDTGRAVILVVDDLKRGQAVAQRVAADAGMKLIIIDADDVLDLPPRNNFRKMAPAVIYLAPGNWYRGAQENEDEEFAGKRRAFQKRLVKWIEEFDVTYPIVLVTSNNELGDMSGIIDCPNSFDRYFALPPIPLSQIGQSFIDDLGSDRCGESLTAVPDKLGKLLADDFLGGNRREMAQLYLRRLYRREQRPIEFLDLMHLSTHGFGEEASTEPQSEKVRRSVAIHEAGHAAMAILDSGGNNIPDYCSIVAGADFKGVVAESVSYHQSLGDRMTYLDFRHQVRIGLAGRAAEELAFGSGNVSAGASNDLAKAWQRAYMAFSRLGFAPGMDSAEASASNLGVVVGDPTPTESEYVESLIRQFLGCEYMIVLKLLGDHRPFLEAIAERLMWDPVVDQSELSEICHAHLKFKNELQEKLCMTIE
jgi:cell division protease FtsH